MVLFVVWHNVSLRGKLDVASRKSGGRDSVSSTRSRSSRLALLQQEGQKLFDSARVAVAAGDWPTARVDLEKLVTTIGSETRLGNH